MFTAEGGSGFGCSFILGRRNNKSALRTPSFFFFFIVGGGGGGFKGPCVSKSRASERSHTACTAVRPPTGR